MRRAFEELRATLAEYVEQDEHTLLVLSGSDAEVGYALKALEGVEATNEHDLFFAFPMPMQSASEWVTQTASLVSAQMDATNEHRAREGQEPLPAFPLGACIDVRIAPEVRMRALVDFLRALLPDEARCRLVLALLPTSIADVEGYARIIGALSPIRGAEPWMRPLRVVARDDADARPLARALGVHGYEVLDEGIHMSTPALLHWLQLDAADPELDASARMASLLQLAVMDFASRRYDDALAKLGQLVPHFAREGAAAMHAVALTTVGDVARAQSSEPASLRFALERYQQASAVALAHEQWMPLRNAVLGAGETSLALGAAGDAESYFDSAARISHGFLDTAGFVESRTKQGDAALAARRYGEAASAWREASEVASKVGDHVRQIAPLERLAALYREAHRSAELAEVERDLRDVRAQAGAASHHH